MLDAYRGPDYSGDSRLRLAQLHSDQDTLLNSLTPTNVDVQRQLLIQNKEARRGIMGPTVDAAYSATPAGYGQNVAPTSPNADPRLRQALLDVEQLKQVVQKQQDWINSQPLRKHIKEGIELYEKSPLSWKRIGRRAALATAAVLFTAFAAPAITGGIPFWTLAWFFPESALPSALPMVGSAIAGLTAAAGVQVYRIRQKIKDASDKLREKYGQDVIVEGRAWTLRNMTSKSQLLEVSAAGLLLGGLMEVAVPGLQGLTGSETAGEMMRGGRDTVWRSAKDAIGWLWGAVRP